MSFHHPQTALAANETEKIIFHIDQKYKVMIDQQMAVFFSLNSKSVCFFPPLVMVEQLGCVPRNLQHKIQFTVIYL